MLRCRRLLPFVLACSLIPSLSAPGQNAQPAAKPAAAPATSAAPAGPTPLWIWLNKHSDGQTVFFRTEVDLKYNITIARVYITCDDELSLYIDGQHVLDHANGSVPVAKDITSILAPNSKASQGKHLIAVKAKNNVGPAGLIMRMIFEYQRESQILTTDATWKVSDQESKDWQLTAFADKDWGLATAVGKLGDKPRDTVNETSFAAAAALKEPTATPIQHLKVAKDFRVELLYSVPKNVEGSWVNLCTDPKGRLIVSDQYGGLYRVTPPPLPENGSATPSKPLVLEKINVDIGEAQGLLWAFDSLYVVVNKGQKYDSGVYRVTDTNGDDQLDKVEVLRKLDGGGEHGPHAVVPTPDGKSLYIVCGNGTKLTNIHSSRAPRIWGEDHLLPRMPDGRGFMRDVLGPGGCIYKIDPEGKHWELISNGYRNQFDLAINRAGDLFTYDADMEWDFNTPWYRPTRVCQVTSGSEFGWRNGAGKWPAYYVDSLPAVIDIGPGSPTGITFGYGAKFPAKYQDALFISDWSYGKLYAVHLTPKGATYDAQLEEFVTGTPLPLTDVIINPHDKAMYFAIGGRKVQSGLYRVTYTGSASTAPANTAPVITPEGQLRRELETLHGHRDPATVEKAWPSLGHADRFVRFAARVALENQPLEQWRDKALTEKNPAAALTALLGLVRAGASCPFHRAKDAPPVDAELKLQIQSALLRFTWDDLTHGQRLELLRTYAVFFNRFGPPDDTARQQTIARLDAVYPADSSQLNADLSNLLVYLQAPTAATKTVALLEAAPTQEEQIEYARALRMLKTGWTPVLRQSYFSWFLKAANYKGGASFSLFVEGIRKDAVATLSDAEKAELKPILEAKPMVTPVAVAPPRPFVKKWTLEELTALADGGLKNRNFDHGRKLFGAANCFACHRFTNEGGATGPDLSGAAGRFSRRDLLESIVDPSKQISDQYAAVTIETTEGKVVTGRIVNLAGDSMSIGTNMLNPDEQTRVDRRQIVEILPSKVSMMPEGLMNTLNQDEVLDLLAYLLSRGDRTNEMFRK